VVPTNDAEVKARLREIEQPICKSLQLSSYYLKLLVSVLMNHKLSIFKIFAQVYLVKALQKGVTD
jgi:hypothetical protein